MKRQLLKVFIGAVVIMMLGSCSSKKPSGDLSSDVDKLCDMISSDKISKAMDFYMEMEIMYKGKTPEDLGIAPNEVTRIKTKLEFALKQMNK